MVFNPHKSDAQFWVALCLSIGLILITAGSVIADQFHGQVSQVTMLLAGGLISSAGSSAGWLFKNGNGSEAKPEPAQVAPSPGR